MGAWIEIMYSFALTPDVLSRTPRWVRGLKYHIKWATKSCTCFVAPHDGCVDWNIIPFVHFSYKYMSHPTMGAWIEISLSIKTSSDSIGSHPTMGAWIEICLFEVNSWLHLVAPHDGCVDWNMCFGGHKTKIQNVAPHDGCVDWNFFIYVFITFLTQSHPTMGAWIEIKPLVKTDGTLSSHPTMGAWIEISLLFYLQIASICRTPRWVRGLKSLSSMTMST